MIGREAKAKRTWREVMDHLDPSDGDMPIFWDYYRTLRRRGLGQTSAFVGGWVALDYSQTEISRALGGSLRCAAQNWAGIRARFDLRGVGRFVRFLIDPTAWPSGRRSTPTAQQRPVARAVPRPNSAHAPIRLANVRTRQPGDGAIREVVRRKAAASLAAGVKTRVPATGSCGSPPSPTGEPSSAR